MNLNNYPLWTAVVTPFLENGSVDYRSLEVLLHEQEEAGNAIVILGSTGEALNLDSEEKKEILKFTLGLNLSVPIMAGVGGINLRETKEWIQYLETLPLQAYLLVTPLYAKPGKFGQYEWFKALLDAATRPCMLYNVPGRTAVSMNFEAVAMLKDHPRFWAIKEASGSVFDFKRYQEAAPQAAMYSGDDSMTPVFTSLGAKGLVSVASNAWPKETHEYVKQCLAQKLQDTELWKECSDALFIASNPVPVKALLHYLKRIKTNLMRAPLDHRDLKDIKPVVVAHESIQGWFKDQVK